VFADDAGGGSDAGRVYVNGRRTRDTLSQAREAYNAARYDEAIAAARTAGAAPDFANSANVVLARAYLERFRRSAEPADLSMAERHSLE